jgi:lipopolysaccharide assembly protein A
MQVFVFVALGVALVAVMFALQNIVPVTVAFLAWTFEGSLALLLFVALIVGALVSLLASVPTLLRGRWAATSMKKRIAALEAELKDVRLQLEAAHKQTSAALRSPGPGSGPGSSPARNTTSA